MTCEHSFAYAGVRYCNGTRTLPGTGAVQRYYAHAYFCARCLETVGVPITDKDRGWNSYQKIEFGATPGDPKCCGVPTHDQ